MKKRTLLVVLFFVVFTAALASAQTGNVAFRCERIDIVVPSEFGDEFGLYLRAFASVVGRT